MAYTFAVDIEKIDKLKGALKTAHDSINEKIPTIFTDIESMDDEKSWSGTSYDSFRDGTKKYEKALDTLPQVINVFETELDTIKESADSLINEIGTEISIMSQD